MSALFPVEHGSDTEFVKLDIRVEAQTEVGRNPADHVVFAHLRKSVGVYHDLSGLVALVRAAVYYGEFLADTGTHLRSDKSAEIDAFNTRCKFVYVVVDLREVESEVELEVAVVDRRHSQCEFVRVGMNLTAVHDHAVVAGRA